MGTSSTSNQRVLKGSIVGVSGYGVQHLKFLWEAQEAGLIHLSAAVVTGAAHEKQTIARLQADGCAIFTSLEDMLAKMGSDLDFCTLPTSITSHVPLVCQCLEAGLHILVEKPLCAGTDALEKLMRCHAQHPNQLLTVGFQDWFAPVNRMIRDKLREGYIGEIQRVRLLGAWPRPINYYERNNWAGRVSNAEGLVYDSPLNNAMAHFLNLCIGWGDPQALDWGQVQQVEGSLWRSQRIENFDTATLRLSLQNGVPVGVWVTQASETPIQPLIIVEGEQGTLRWEHEGGISWERNEHCESLDKPTTEEARRRMFLDFIEAIHGSNHPQCHNLDMAIAHVHAIERLQRSVPARNVPDEACSHIQSGDHTFRVVIGIEEMLRAAFDADELMQADAFAPASATRP